MANRILLKGAASVGMILAMAACGGNDGDGFGSGPSQPSADSFFSEVKAVVATSPEDTEPREIDSITATSPEDSEPASLDS